MKNRNIIGIGAAGLICSILGGYYFWGIVNIAALIPGSGNNHNGQAWFWFITCCVGLVLLFTITEEKAIVFRILDCRRNPKTIRNSLKT